MASPQKENGYTAIANPIMDALTKIRISGEARQVFDTILRKTYGFNKKEDAISLSQFSTSTGLKKNSVCKALAHLRDLNLITQKVNDIANIYSINKDFDTWKPLPKKRTLPKKRIAIPQKVKKYTPKSDIQKTVTKDTITKDIGGAEINELLDFFKTEINPHINFGNKTERKACHELIKLYGLKKVKDAALFTFEKQKTDSYVPKVTSPYDLYTKWVKLDLYFKSKLSKERKIENL